MEKLKMQSTMGSYTKRVPLCMSHRIVFTFTPRCVLWFRTRFYKRLRGDYVGKHLAFPTFLCTFVPQNNEYIFNYKQ